MNAEMTMMMAFAVLAVAFGAWAETEKVGGYTAACKSKRGFEKVNVGLVS